MKLIEKKYNTKNGNVINYYEAENDKDVLFLIHGQATDAMSYKEVAKKLAKQYNLIMVDCYGHGKSSHNKEYYNLVDMGNDIIEFIKSKTDKEIILSGHSSGGLIASYIASKYYKCKKLVLEDPPLFASNGEARLNTYNYKDLSTVCHMFINQDDEKDFAYYYFVHQYCWNFFPEDSREKIKNMFCQMALKSRAKHPNKPLKVPFWPKNFAEVFKAMDEYDPYFGENFYNDEFNKGVDYEQILSNIKCETIFLKANAKYGPDGILQGALSEDDLNRVLSLIKGMKVIHLDSGHGIHNELPKRFISAIIND